MLLFLGGAYLGFFAALMLSVRDVRVRRKAAEKAQVELLRGLAFGIEHRISHHPLHMEICDYFADEDFAERARRDRPFEFLIVDAIREMADAKARVLEGTDPEAAFVEHDRKIDQLMRPLADERRVR